MLKFVMYLIKNYFFLKLILWVLYYEYIDRDCNLAYIEEDIRNRTKQYVKDCVKMKKRAYKHKYMVMYLKTYYFFYNPYRDLINYIKDSIIELLSFLKIIKLFLIIKNYCYICLNFIKDKYVYFFVIKSENYQYNKDDIHKAITEEEVKKYCIYINDIFDPDTHYRNSNQSINERYGIGRPMSYKFLREIIVALDYLFDLSIFIEEKKSDIILNTRHPEVVDRYNSLLHYIYVTKLKPYLILKRNNFFSFLILPITASYNLIGKIVYIIAYIIYKLPFFKKSYFLKFFIESKLFFKSLKKAIYFYIDDKWVYWKLKYKFIRDYDLVRQQYLYFEDVYLKGEAYFARLDNIYFDIQIIKKQFSMIIESLKFFIISTFFEIYIIFFAYTLFFINYAFYIYKNHPTIDFFMDIQVFLVVPFILPTFVAGLLMLPDGADPVDYDNRDQAIFPAPEEPYIKPKNYDFFEKDEDVITDINNDTFKFTRNPAYDEEEFIDEELFPSVTSLDMEVFPQERGIYPHRGLTRWTTHCYSEFDRTQEALDLVCYFPKRFSLSEIDFFEKNLKPTYKKDVTDVFLEELENSVDVTNIRKLAMESNICFTTKYEQHYILEYKDKGYSYEHEVKDNITYYPVFDIITPYITHQQLSYYEARQQRMRHFREISRIRAEKYRYSPEQLSYLKIKKYIYPHEDNTIKEPGATLEKYFLFGSIDRFKLPDEIVDELEYIEQIHPMSNNMDFAYFEEYLGDIDSSSYQDHDDFASDFQYQRSCVNLTENYIDEIKTGPELHLENTATILANHDDIVRSMFEYKSDAPIPLFDFGYVYKIFPVMSLLYTYLEEHYYEFDDLKLIDKTLLSYDDKIGETHLYLRFYRVRGTNTHFILPNVPSGIYLNRDENYDGGYLDAYPVLHMIVDSNFFYYRILPRLLEYHKYRRKKRMAEVNVTKYYKILNFEPYCSMRAHIDPLLEIYPSLKVIDDKCKVCFSDPDYYEKLYNEFAQFFEEQFKLLKIYILILLFLFFKLNMLNSLFSYIFTDFTFSSFADTLGWYECLGYGDSIFYANEIKEVPVIVNNIIFFEIPKYFWNAVKIIDFIFEHYISANPTSWIRFKVYAGQFIKEVLEFAPTRDMVYKTPAHGREFFTEEHKRKSIFY